MSTAGVLLFHCVVIGAILLVAGRLLWTRGLFGFRSAGFWAWCGILLYLLLPPALSLWQGDLTDYKFTLGLSGGAGRALWITAVTALGISSFYFVYFRTRPASRQWALLPDRAPLSFTGPQVLVLVATIGVGLWSLITYRSGLIQETGIVVINGRNYGSTTGYQYTAHIFLFFPVALFLLHPSRGVRCVGYLLAVTYVVIGSLDPYARFLQVSMILVVAIASVCRIQHRRWPNPLLIAAAAGVALLLGIRGHVVFSSPGDVLAIAQQAPSQITQQFTGGNANLLSNWYLQSYLDDSLVGYNYGLQLLNYLIAGYLPGHFFPNKYFLIDWLHSQQPVITNPVILNRTAYQASSLLGTFYSDGGVVGVGLLAAAWGYLSRKIEGLNDPGSPMLARALGVCWLALLWMVWGRGDFWAADYMFTAAVPALVLWMVSPKQRRAEQRAHAQPPAGGVTTIQQPADRLVSGATTPRSAGE